MLDFLYNLMLRYFSLVFESIFLFAFIQWCLQNLLYKILLCSFAVLVVIKFKHFVFFLNDIKNLYGLS